jgi:hypothetical protein
MDRTREFTGLILARSSGHDDKNPDLTAHKWQLSRVRDEYTQEAYRIVTRLSFASLTCGWDTSIR